MIAYYDFIEYANPIFSILSDVFRSKVMILEPVCKGPAFFLLFRGCIIENATVLKLIYYYYVTLSNFSKLF